MTSDVPLGQEGSTPIYLRDSHRTAHVAILGKSRFGKTTLLEHLVLHDMRNSTAAIVIDAHGDLTRRLAYLTPYSARDKIVVVEPNAERPFGLNLYECSDPTDSRQVTTTVGSAVEIFFKLMGVEGTGFLPIIESGLRNTARVLIANRLTMAEIPLLYHDAAFRRRALAALPAPTDYWLEYERSTFQKQQEKREPVLNKVARFLEDDLIAPMVSQEKTTIPFTSIMENGGTLLLNLAGLDRETVSFLGMVFLSVFSGLIHQRESIPKRERRPVHLYLDEYGRFATPTTKRLIEEGGKYGLGVTIAHQNLSQTPEREALNVQSLITFQLSPEDAYDVAGSFDYTPTRTKRVARQRTEPQYREWEEEVWDSEQSQRHYEKLSRDLKEAESRYSMLEHDNATASQMMDAFFPSGDEKRPVLHAFDSSDGTVDGVYMLRRFERNPHLVASSAHRQLRELLTRLYAKYGREPRGEDELEEAHQWLYEKVLGYDALYQKTEELLPGARERLSKLESEAVKFRKRHTSIEQRTEYVGEAPVKGDQGKFIYDNIEELDQSHADRRAEIANMLTQLPRYVAYCKVHDLDGKSHEHRIQTSPPAKPDLIERALRLRKKLRGADLDIMLENFGSSTSEVGYTFTQKEFEKAMAGFMQDLRDSSSYGPRIPDKGASDEDAREIRVRSREQFGTSRADIEQQIRARQGRPDDGEGGSGHPARPGDGGPHSPTIGRRSPKKRG